jgi:hypothetical protein
VKDKTLRVQRFQEATVAEAQQIMASMGVTAPSQLHPAQLRRRLDHTNTRSYAELFEWLSPGELLADPPQDWVQDWKDADPDRFQVEGRRRTSHSP